MCPEAEYIARKRDNQLSRFEKITKSDGEIQYVALKAYRRPAAGRTDILLHEVHNPRSLIAHHFLSNGMVVCLATTATNITRYITSFILQNSPMAKWRF